MLQLAIDRFAAVEALMVGDRPEDEAAAKNAGIQFLWDFEWRGDAE
jgi:phosphoglycolate phosphatase-like HAD superfamily hydrolase